MKFISSICCGLVLLVRLSSGNPVTQCIPVSKSCSEDLTNGQPFKYLLKYSGSQSFSQVNGVSGCCYIYEFETKDKYSCSENTLQSVSIDFKKKNDEDCFFCSQCKNVNDGSICVQNDATPNGMISPVSCGKDVNTCEYGIKFGKLSDSDISSQKYAVCFGNYPESCPTAKHGFTITSHIDNKCSQTTTKQVDGPFFESKDDICRNLKIKNPIMVMMFHLRPVDMVLVQILPQLINIHLQVTV